MQRVLVINRKRQSLMPCHPARARKLLQKGRAVIFRRYPFVIMLKICILYQTLWKLVRGLDIPRDHNLLKICEALEITHEAQIARVLLLAYQARMPEAYQRILDPLIAFYERLAEQI